MRALEKLNYCWKSTTFFGKVQVLWEQSTPCVGKSSPNIRIFQLKKYVTQRWADTRYALQGAEVFEILITVFGLDYVRKIS
jgi:hypothetical protein